MVRLAQSGPAATGARTGGRGRRFGVFTAALVITGIAAELLVRGWAYHLREEFEQYDYATGAYHLVPGQYGSDPAKFVTINSDGFRGPELSRQKPGLRIVAVGDSCTFGAGSGQHSYPALLQELLGARKPRAIDREMVNAGISGADSEGASRRLVSKVLPLEPDIVTIYIGWNDLMKYSPRAQTGAGLAGRIARQVDQLWLVRGLRKMVFFHLRPAVNAPEIGADSRTERFQRFHPRAFEKNLRNMTEAILAAGARPVLVTLPTALSEGLSAERIRERQIGFPYFRGANRVGDFLDLIDAYNRTIRHVAIDNEALVVDLALAFSTLPDPAPYFWDTMHPNNAGQELVAKLFERTLDRAGLLGPWAQPD